MKPTYLWAEDIKSGDIIHLGDGEVFNVYVKSRRNYNFNWTNKGNKRKLPTDYYGYYTLYDEEMISWHVKELSTHEVLLADSDPRAVLNRNLCNEEQKRTDKDFDDINKEFGWSDE